jgi:hypothetical protein
MTVGLLGTRSRQRVENRDFGLFQVRKPKHFFWLGAFARFLSMRYGGLLCRLGRHASALNFRVAITRPQPRLCV